MNYPPDNLKSKKSSKRNAFTLVELLAVVAVMLLVLKLTLPTLDGLMGKNGKGMARGQLIGDLNRARSLALQNGESVYLVFMPTYSGVGFYPANTKSSYFNSNSATNALLGMQLTGYAIYSEDRPNTKTAKWHSDWKRLPEGFYFDSKTLDSLPHSVTVDYLKPPRGAATYKVTLPALKYNSRGVLDAADLAGIYLSVSKGGVFPPGLGAGGKYVPDEDADEPDEQPPDDRQWLHINGVTGRAGVVELTQSEIDAGMSIANRINVSGYNVYITGSPILPNLLQRELRAICAGFDHDNSYQPNWLDSSPPWVPAGNHYPIPVGRDGKFNPIFKNVSGLKAIELRKALEELGRYEYEGGIKVRVYPSDETVP